MKETSAREISTLKQREIELESDLKALKESMQEAEDSLVSLKSEHSKEISRLSESHKQDLEQLKLAHESELANSLGNTPEFESSKKETDLRILHLDSKMVDLNEERSHLLRQIEVYKDEARKLRYEISKKEMQNSRLSEVFHARTTEVNPRFSEISRMSSEFENPTASNKFVRIFRKI